MTRVTFASRRIAGKLLGRNNLGMNKTQRENFAHALTRMLTASRAQGLHSEERASLRASGVSARAV